jgi:hypothetical protein
MPQRVIDTGIRSDLKCDRYPARIFFSRCAVQRRRERPQALQRRLPGGRAGAGHRIRAEQPGKFGNTEETAPRHCLRAPPVPPSFISTRRCAVRRGNRPIPRYFHCPLAEPHVRWPLRHRRVGEPHHPRRPDGRHQLARRRVKARCKRAWLAPRSIAPALALSVTRLRPISGWVGTLGPFSV